MPAQAGRHVGKTQGQQFLLGEIAGAGAQVVEIILIDELLTPDSSRFWPRESYRPGGGQQSFDKQYLRDYLISLDWDKQPPGPVLPDEIIARSSAKYLEAFERLVGRPL